MPATFSITSARLDRYSYQRGFFSDLRFIDPLRDSEEWDVIVQEHPASHIFHTSAWARVLQATYGHKPFYLLAHNPAGPVAAIPVMEIKSPITGIRAANLPFSDFCPPLFFSENATDPAVRALLDLGFARGWKSLRLNRPLSDSNVEPDRPTAYSHRVELRVTPEEMLKQFEGSVRRAIHKAEKAGIEVTRQGTCEALRDFYFLHCHTRRRHGLPPQPWRFFENIYREIFLPGNGLVFTARKDSKNIAAAVFLRVKDKVLYKFAASRSSFQQYRPGNLVIWEAMRFFASTGAVSLHFGRTDSKDHGLRRFKLGWGSVEESLASSSFDFRQRRWHADGPIKTGLHNKLFRRMPIAFNRFAGARIYPHLD